MEKKWQITDGYLQSARQICSPNCNQRPPGSSIDLLVIHNISLPAGCFGGGYIEQLFTNCLDVAADSGFADLCGLEVSSHLLIDRSGEVTQFVPFTERAWHAGQSCFEGRPNCNDFSIGIELEGCDDVPYTTAQYQQLIAIVAQLMHCYPGIRPQRIVGHSDIAPVRKTDPGPAFAWDYFFSELQCSLRAG